MLEFNIVLVVGHQFDSGSLRSKLKSCIQIRTCRVTDENCDSLVFLEDMELGSAMPQLYRVFSLVATVGATSSGVERSFCLKRLKSYTRGQRQFKQPTLLAIEGTLVKSLEKTASWYDRVTEHSLEKEQRAEVTYNNLQSI